MFEKAPIRQPSFLSSRLGVSNRLASPWLLYFVLVLLALALHLIDLGTTHHHVLIYGGCNQASNAALHKANGSGQAAITYCNLGDGDKGTLETTSFPAGTRRITLETSGYGASNGQSLSFVDHDDNRMFLVPSAAGEHWGQETVLVPTHISRMPFKLVAQDSSSQFQGWIGMSISSYSSIIPRLSVLSLALLTVALLHFLTTELASFLLHFSPNAQALTLMLLAAGFLSFASFWIYYASPVAGMIFSAALLAGLVLHALIRIIRRDEQFREDIQAIHAAIAPISTLVIVLFVLGFYPFPDHWDTWQYAANRWVSLPMDNWLPKYFADQVWNGHVSKPMIGDWLSSDRPPLQTGFYLLLKPLAPDSDALYQLASMWLQATFLIPTAVFITHLGLCRTPTMLLFSMSALVLYNGTFVWPKLIAATFCMVCYLALFSPAPRSINRAWLATIVGASAAFAMLSHGGVLFAIVAIFAVYGLRSGAHHWLTLSCAILIALTIYAPWILYQKLIDPPGTRLVAWHIAGVVQPSSLPLGVILRNAYASLTFDQWLHGRVANLLTICRGSFDFYNDALHLIGSGSAEAIQRILAYSFLWFGYSQWFFSPAITGVAAIIGWRRLRSILSELTPLLATMCLGLVIWSVLMFKPSSTIIHQGAYFLNLAALLISAAIVNAVSRTLFFILLGGNLLIFVRVFVFSHRVVASAVPSLPEVLLNANWHAAGDYLFLCLLGLVAALHYLAIGWGRNLDLSETMTKSRSTGTTCSSRKFIQLSADK
jgi:hypothetical protein